MVINCENGCPPSTRVDRLQQSPHATLQFKDAGYRTCKWTFYILKLPCKLQCSCMGALVRSWRSDRVMTGERQLGGNQVIVGHGQSVYLPCSKLTCTLHCRSCMHPGTWHLLREHNPNPCCTLCGAALPTPTCERGAQAVRGMLCLITCRMLTGCSWLVHQL
jgi:hypothetical protein